VGMRVRHNTFYCMPIHRDYESRSYADRRAITLGSMLYKPGADYASNDSLIITSTKAAIFLLPLCMVRRLIASKFSMEEAVCFYVCGFWVKRWFSFEP
jgi:hypothetical protein